MAEIANKLREVQKKGKELRVDEKSVFYGDPQEEEKSDSGREDNLPGLEGTREKGLRKALTVALSPGKASLPPSEVLTLFEGTLQNESPLREGLGLLIELSGENSCKEYWGGFAEGRREGTGFSKDPQGSFIGTFKRGKRSGPGEFRASLPENPSSSSGSLEPKSIKGYYFQGQLQGFCCLRVPVNKYAYTGGMKDSGLNGVGKEHNEEGVYVGEFRDSQKDGLGYYKTNQGTSYLGEWADNSRQGFGIEEDTLGGNYYEGGFSRDQRSGICQTSLGSETLSFLGEISAGVPHGFGQLHSTDFCYTGEFVDGRREGLGYQTNKQGKTFFGNWKRDIKTGYGYVVDHNIEYKGSFSNDLPNGLGIIKMNKEPAFVAEVVDGNVQNILPKKVSEVIPTFDCLDYPKFEAQSIAKLRKFHEYLNQRKKSVLEKYMTLDFDLKSKEIALEEKLNSIKDEIKGTFNDISDIHEELYNSLRQDPEKMEIMKKEILKLNRCMGGSLAPEISGITDLDQSQTRQQNSNRIILRVQNYLADQGCHPEEESILRGREVIPPNDSPFHLQANPIESWGSQPQDMQNFVGQEPPQLLSKPNYMIMNMDSSSSCNLLSSRRNTGNTEELNFLAVRKPENVFSERPENLESGVRPPQRSVARTADTGSPPLKTLDDRPSLSGAAGEASQDSSLSSQARKSLTEPGTEREPTSNRTLREVAQDYVQTILTDCADQAGGEDSLSQESKSTHNHHSQGLSFKKKGETEQVPSRPQNTPEKRLPKQDSVLTEMTIDQYQVDPFEQSNLFDRTVTVNPSDDKENSKKKNLPPKIPTSKKTVEQAHVGSPEKLHIGSKTENEISSNNKENKSESLPPSIADSKKTIEQYQVDPLEQKSQLDKTMAIIGSNKNENTQEESEMQASSGETSERLPIIPIEEPQETCRTEAQLIRDLTQESHHLQPFEQKAQEDKFTHEKEKDNDKEPSENKKPLAKKLTQEPVQIQPLEQALLNEQYSMKKEGFEDPPTQSLHRKTTQEPLSVFPAEQVSLEEQCLLKKPPLQTLAKKDTLEAVALSPEELKLQEEVCFSKRSPPLAKKDTLEVVALNPGELNQEFQEEVCFSKRPSPPSLPPQAVSGKTLEQAELSPRGDRGRADKFTLSREKEILHRPIPGVYIWAVGFEGWRAPRKNFNSAGLYVGTSQVKEMEHKAISAVCLDQPINSNQLPPKAEVQHIETQTSFREKIQSLSNQKLTVLPPTVQPSTEDKAISVLVNSPLEDKSKKTILYTSHKCLDNSNNKTQDETFHISVENSQLQVDSKEKETAEKARKSAQMDPNPSLLSSIPPQSPLLPGHPLMNSSGYSDEEPWVLSAKSDSNIRDLKALQNKAEVFQNNVNDPSPAIPLSQNSIQMPKKSQKELVSSSRSNINYYVDGKSDCGGSGQVILVSKPIPKEEEKSAKSARSVTPEEDPKKESANSNIPPPETSLPAPQPEYNALLSISSPPREETLEELTFQRDSTELTELDPPAESSRRNLFQVEPQSAEILVPVEEASFVQPASPACPEIVSVSQGPSSTALSVMESFLQDLYGVDTGSVWTLPVIPVDGALSTKSPPVFVETMRWEKPPVEKPLPENGENPPVVEKLSVERVQTPAQEVKERVLDAEQMSIISDSQINGIMGETRLEELGNKPLTTPDRVSERSVELVKPSRVKSPAKDQPSSAKTVTKEEDTNQAPPAERTNPFKDLFKGYKVKGKEAENADNPPEQNTVKLAQLATNLFIRQEVERLKKESGGEKAPLPGGKKKDKTPALYSKNPDNPFLKKNMEDLKVLEEKKKKEQGAVKKKPVGDGIKNNPFLKNQGIK